MKFASAVDLVHELDRDVDAICARAERDLGEPADLVLAFFTSHFEDDAERLSAILSRRFSGALVVGCSAEGVCGRDIEHERVPAMSVMLARLPGVKVQPFRAGPEDLSSGQAVQNWIGSLGVSAEQAPTFVFLADPFTVPIKAVLHLFDIAYTGCPLLGGMVSGCEGPGQAVLILNGQVHRDGAVGLAITGAVEVRTVVSQGCRPVGERFVITRARDNVIEQLGGKPALHQLRNLLKNLSGDDLVLAQRSLFIGMVINEHKGEFKRGDFVIRHLLAGDPNSGSIVVGDEVRVGSSIQFHVRDEHSADQDLRELLESALSAAPPAGALLFTCNGRGTRMWDEPHHDASVLGEICGTAPMAGFFAAGELGPIDGRNLIHGHTASIGLFYPIAAE